jgi:hypothetical protein
LTRLKKDARGNTLPLEERPGMHTIKLPTINASTNSIRF